ncbi:MAG TPA: CDP-alcohol phosphatidyltransferase family protein [Bryobacteraceae bacterium]|nr:CDP-alcohol phosphatidyltransferase family protein [Bryobacteraceae bacterium]
MRQIPNAICLLRIVLTPFCFSAIVRRDFGLAMALFAVAGFTDFLDGFVARRMNWNSAAGALLDPLADKILMATVYIALGIAGAAPWWVVGIIFGRDIVILLGSALLYQRVQQKKFPPTMAGKISTVTQIFSAMAIMGGSAGIFPPSLATAAILATAGTTLYSGLDYVRRGYSIISA